MENGSNEKDNDSESKLKKERDRHRREIACLVDFLNLFFFFSGLAIDKM